ncbi:hypothetical protein [Qipengyuania spongiae]|uniref:Uncharacterized protein n=1 Tax=Qipengyuania spongiae TaxID=2909673 RepID=A0ABY5T0K3_9SPHN|nr:hypothetical protein [Qipengyuania spongiae]UVI40120.1 hypothetical protein L1F33_03955 [Qipengyuania spongiae]
MEIPATLLQFLGSLAAILVLAGMAWKLGLGPGTTIASEDEARVAAEEAFGGYEPRETAIARDGRGVIMRDAAGAIMVLKPHGTHLAGRILGSRASAKTERDGGEEYLVVTSGERRFGTVRLAIDDATLWSDRVNAIGWGRNA